MGESHSRGSASELVSLLVDTFRVLVLTIADVSESSVIRSLNVSASNSIATGVIVAIVVFAIFFIGRGGGVFIADEVKFPGGFSNGGGNANGRVPFDEPG